MFSKIWKSLPIFARSSLPNCLPYCHHQVASHESVHEANSALKWINCDACVEENKVCKCEVNTKDLKFVVNDKEAEHLVDANSSFLHSVINMVGMLIGLGQLSTPYALENGGWASVFLLIGLGVACTYSSYLLGKCLEKNPKLRNYTDIGHNAFGMRGRVIAATFIYLEIFMALVSYTISLHDNITMVFLGTHLSFSWTNYLSTSQILTVIALLVALPSLWLRDLSLISFLSTGGILMSLLIFITVVCTAISGVLKPTIRFQLCSYGTSLTSLVSIVSFTLVMMLYTALACMGVKLFGPEVNSQITLSMPRGLILTKIALWTTVLTPMTKYALEFAPFAMQLEHHLSCSMSSRTKKIIRGGVGSFLLLTILALALSVPYFEYVLGLTGSLVSVGICIICPSAFYMKIFWSQISKPALILNMTLITIGTLLGVSGTMSSLKLLIQNLQKAHSA